MALFVQAMLSKVSNAIVYMSKTIDAGDVFSTTSGISSHTDKAIASVTTPGDGKKYKYNLSVNYYLGTSSHTFKISIDGGEKTTWYNPTSYEGTITKQVECFKSFTIYVYQTTGNTMTLTVNSQSNSYNIGLTKVPNNAKKGYPRELKQIAEKASITIFGVHTNNERIEDFKGALSTNFEYVASKGNAHKTTSISTKSYTAIGYGYCRYDVKSNGNEYYVKLNGITLGYVNENGAHLTNLIFFKPGDVLQFDSLYSFELVDYY